MRSRASWDPGLLVPHPEFLLWAQILTFTQLALGQINPLWGKCFQKGKMHSALLSSVFSFLPSDLIQALIPWGTAPGPRACLPW